VTFQKAAELNAALRDHFAQHASDMLGSNQITAARV
jgi:hypothetical protein